MVTAPANYLGQPNKCGHVDKSVHTLFFSISQRPAHIENIYKYSIVYNRSSFLREACGQICPHLSTFGAASNTVPATWMERR